MAKIEQILSPEAIRTAGDRPEHPLYDATGQPIKVGNQDPNIIGPDDKVNQLQTTNLRNKNLYSKNYPPLLFQAEEQFVLPLAAHVAQQICQVDLIDELTYAKILLQLKQNNLMAVLDISTPSIQNNVVVWEGFKLMCKDFKLVGVTFRLDMSLPIVTIPYIKVWQNAANQYACVGDPSMIRDLPREQVATIIANYLRAEGVL